MTANQETDHYACMCWSQQNRVEMGATCVVAEHPLEDAQFSPISYYATGPLTEDSKGGLKPFDECANTPHVNFSPDNSTIQVGDRTILLENLQNPNILNQTLALVTQLYQQGTKTNWFAPSRRFLLEAMATLRDKLRPHCNLNGICQIFESYLPVQNSIENPEELSNATNAWERLTNLLTKTDFGNGTPEEITRKFGKVGGYLDKCLDVWLLGENDSKHPPLPPQSIYTLLALVYGATGLNPIQCGYQLLCEQEDWYGFVQKKTQEATNRNLDLNELNLRLEQLKDYLNTLISIDMSKPTLLNFFTLNKDNADLKTYTNDHRIAIDLAGTLVQKMTQPDGQSTWRWRPGATEFLSVLQRLNIAVAVATGETDQNLDTIRNDLPNFDKMLGLNTPSCPTPLYNPNHTAFPSPTISTSDREVTASDTDKSYKITAFMSDSQRRCRIIIDDDPSPTSAKTMRALDPDALIIDPKRYRWEKPEDWAPRVLYQILSNICLDIPENKRGGTVLPQQLARLAPPLPSLA